MAGWVEGCGRVGRGCGKVGRGVWQGGQMGVTFWVNVYIDIGLVGYI